MSTPPEHAPQPSDEDPCGDLYDAYLEGALAGHAQEPEDFLGSHPDVTGAQREELLDRLQAISHLVGRGPELAEQVAGQEEELGQLGGFRLLRRLGGGAMGEVFLAEQTSIGRLVALKTQRAEMAFSPTASARFEREAQALGQVNHSAVVGIHGFGREGEIQYLAMELLPGRSLKELLTEPRSGEQPPAPAQVARWGLDLAHGLAAVHVAGLLHRDVKPANVRISEDGNAVLVDFGLARLSSSSDLSRTGEFIGSPAYASPEQVRGEADIDGRADVYSLGATLYHALAGQPPFKGDSLESVLHAVLNRDPVPLRSLNSALPRDLENVCMRAMEKARERRYATAADFAADLNAVLEFRPVQAKRVGFLGRIQRWSRRNRAAAASMLMTGVTIALAGLFLVWNAHLASNAQLDLAAEQLQSARQSVATYRTERLALFEDERAYDELFFLQEYQHLGDESLLQLAELEATVSAARARRDGAYREVGNLLDQAGELDPRLKPAIDGVWAELLIERMVEAEDRGDLAARGFFDQELERRDPEGAKRSAAYPHARLTFTSTVPGARAWLFRYRELDELPKANSLMEKREVPVPVDPKRADRIPNAPGFTPPVPWGTHVLRLTQAAGDFSAGDVILDIDGHGIGGGPFVAKLNEEVAVASAAGPRVGDRMAKYNGHVLVDNWDFELLLSDAGEGPRKYEFDTDQGPLSVTTDSERGLGVDLVDALEWAREGGRKARVFTQGAVREVTLPEGLELRPTAAAVFLVDHMALDFDSEIAMDPGRYLVVSSAPGRMLQRMFIEPKQGTEHSIAIDPQPLKSAPAGFVYVNAPLTLVEPVWVAEMEVTAKQYLEFLNTPSILKRVDEAIERGEGILFPRSTGNLVDWGLWDREESGQFVLPSDWPEMWPALGVSYSDALAYCEWATERSESGSFRLLRDAELLMAGSGGRKFSWGDRFDQRFANTCFSRLLARPEPVATSVRDESPFGVFDTCGNVMEWVDSWFDESRSLRRVAGGAWGQARIGDLGVNGGRGLGVDACGGETGFRIAWVP